MFDRMAEIWCQAMHRQTTWPMHGRYTCLQCGRQYRVAWYPPDYEEVRVNQETREEPSLEMDSLSVVR